MKKAKKSAKEQKKEIKKEKKEEKKAEKKIEKNGQPEWKTKPIGGMVAEPGSSLRYFTGTWKTMRPITDFSRCIHCLKCVVYCPDNCIKTKNDKKDHTENQYCKGCGICAQVCPVKCIRMEDEEKFHE